MFPLKLRKSKCVLFVAQELDLFKDWYTNLARMKIESEGFPKSVTTDEDKKRYCDRINAKMPGINLEPARVKRNMARRNFAKLISNSSLGKK